MLTRISVAVAGLWLTLAGAAPAQNYPTKPVTMIIPFAAGGPTDVLGSVMAQRMSEILGQQVVVENVGGAGGMTGSKRVADAAPDGYTFVLGTVGTHAQGQSLYKKPLYNAVDRFHPGCAYRRGPDRAHHAQGPAGQQSPGVRRLREGQSGQDAVRLGRSRLCHSPGLRAAQLSHRRRYHARSLSRHRSCDAGPPGRSDRLPVRDRQHRQAPDRRRHRQGHRDHDEGALEGAAECPDRHRAGRAQPRSLHLERHFPAEGSAGG